MALSSFRIVRRGTGPIVAAAVHDGHDVREDTAGVIALEDLSQLREEDPFTAGWAQVAPTQIVGVRSRFEVDLNRPREKAVYRTPDDAWGLQVWKSELPQANVDASLRQYDEFYDAVGRLLQELVDRYERVVVYDLHTYNHCRDGADGPKADTKENPEVNIGTGTMDRKFWSPVVDRFVSDLSAADYRGRSLDVRENVKFQGGYFGQWIHERFPRQVCAIAVEFKKFFMDEWSGEPDLEQVAAIYDTLQSTVPGVHEALEAM